MIEYRLPVCDSFRKMRIQKCPMNCGTNIFIEDRLESEKYIMLHENNGMESFYIPIDKDDMKHSLNTIPIAGILISIREEEQIVQGGADKNLDYYRTPKGVFICILKNKKQLH